MKLTNSSSSQKPGPLDGIKVVEYGVFHAGPGGGAILGDLGAEVIKIEADAGDPIRYWTQVGGLNMAMKNGESLMFEVSNRNKKGIYLDIKTEKGREVMERLVKDADVFLTNLRKPTKIKMKLDYESIKKINPKIIHASVSGYGLKGPLSEIGAFDPLGQACSGMMFVTGSSVPAPLHMGILDQATAISLSHSIITALFHRERKGVGQEVHVSLYGTALWLQHPNLMVSNALGQNPCLPQDRYKHSPLRNAFCCKDNRWLFGTHHPEEKYWETFCRITGQEHLFTDPKFTNEKGQPINLAELVDLFDQIFLTKNSSEWMEIFLENRMMFCPIHRIDDVEKDPQALVNNYVVPAEYRGIGQVNLPGYPAYFSECDAGIRHEAPRMGEHTDMILKEAGYSPEEIDQLKLEGAAKSLD